MYKVSSTSDLVLHLAGRSLYESAAAKKFWENVDIEPSRPFAEAHLRIWNDSREEVTNRKFGIKKFCDEFLARTPNSQVIFLGAGLDPKSLDLAESYPETRVFDVDMDNMDLKRQITQDINGPQNMEFCSVDIGNTEQLTSVLCERGWDRSQVTLVVAEGITYYVPKELFKEALQALRTSGGALILEYAVPQEDVVVPAGIIHPSERAFDHIKQQVGMENALNRYSVQEVHMIGDYLKAKDIITLNQKQLERERCGKNEFYSDQYSGALCISNLNFA